MTGRRAEDECRGDVIHYPEIERRSYRRPEVARRMDRIKENVRLLSSETAAGRGRERERESDASRISRY